MLAKRMTEGLYPGARVIELGAGTGTVTEAILAAGVRACDLHVVERNREFAQILRKRFPLTEVHGIDADSVERRLPSLVGEVDFIVSGLPILWFRRAKKVAILTAAFAMLRSGGFFHQFTYTGRPPVGTRLMDELGLKATLAGIAPFNIPPAFVYRFQKNSD
jgi:phospholipid N-methyltransferase